MKTQLTGNRKTTYRTREIAMLALFTFASALVSIAAMDLLVTPVALFAVNRTAAFNFVITYILTSSIAALLVLFITVRIVRMKRNGLPVKSIMLYLLKKPVRWAGTGLAFLFISGLLIASLYIVLSWNNGFLHKIAG